MLGAMIGTAAAGAALGGLMDAPTEKGAGSTISPEQRKLMQQYMDSYGPESAYGQKLMSHRESMMDYNPMYEYDPTSINQTYNKYYRPEFTKSMNLAQDQLDQGFTGKNKNYWSTGRARAKTTLGSNLASQANRQLAKMHDTGQARGIAAAEAARGRQMQMAQLDPAKGMAAAPTQQPYMIQGESPLTQGMNFLGAAGNAGQGLSALAAL